MKDEHGYPTEEALELIKEWDGNDQLGMMVFVKKCWWIPEWGWDEEDGKNFLNKNIRIFNISTGGWSGNEDLIEAMQKNMIFWMLSWYSSRVGGHYVFKVRKEDSEVNEWIKLFCDYGVKDACFTLFTILLEEFGEWLSDQGEAIVQYSKKLMEEYQ